MQRTYIVAIEGGVNFDFSQKWKKWEIFENMTNFLYGLAIFMSLYGLYINKPWKHAIFSLCIETKHMEDVQEGFLFFFLFFCLLNISK